MKRGITALFIAIFALCLPKTAAAQEQMEILKGVSALYDSNYNMDFAPIADLTYPKVVENLGGKEKFLAKLDSDYQNDKYRKRLQLTAPVFQVNAIKTLGGVNFCIVSYRNPTRYFYEQKLSAGQMEAEVGEWKRVAATKEVYGEPNRNSINVKRVSRFVGVMDGSTDGKWKFFDFDDPAQAAQFDILFSTQKTRLGL